MYVIKGTVSVISSYPHAKNGNVGLVSLKPLSNQVINRYQCL